MTGVPENTMRCSGGAAVRRCPRPAAPLRRARADARRRQAVGNTACRRGAGAVRSMARYQPPIVGVPVPTATANTCSAVIPLPALALTVGSVTEATVLPAASGTDAK